MTDDLVKRLRATCSCNIDNTPCLAEEECRVAQEAAARIEELEAKLTKAVEVATSAVDAVHEVQTYEQPDDPWTENALTMRELDVFDFEVSAARAALAELKDGAGG